MNTITRQPVQSSAITSIGHDPFTNTLDVEFASGVVHRYRDVSAEQFLDLLHAASIGKHFATELRHLPNAKLTDEEA